MKTEGKVVSITFEEAIAALDAIVVAWDESQLRQDSARLAKRLIEEFGETVLDASHRSWFPREIDKQLAQGN